MDAFSKQDRRSYTLITPCKRSAARGKRMLLSTPELRSSSISIVQKNDLDEKWFWEDS